MPELKDIDISDSTLASFLKLIHRYTGITIAPSKKLMLQGRLRPRMRKLNLETFEDYLSFIESNAAEKQDFVDLITTNETYFYRTTRVWEYLEKEFLPMWIAANSGVPFNVWSAASSTGEEAHTLAIFLNEFKLRNPKFSYQVFASDISKDVLEHAIAGKYSGRSIDSFRKQKPELFARYMKETEAGKFSLLPEVRKNIKFSLHNLFERPKFSENFDLVLLRNVLIYFGTEDQEKVLQQVSTVMKKNSVLIIGESESLTHLKSRFCYQMPLVYGLGTEQNSKKIGESA